MRGCFEAVLVRSDTVRRVPGFLSRRLLAHSIILDDNVATKRQEPVN